jgi:hypothetical protein
MRGRLWKGFLESVKQNSDAKAHRENGEIIAVSGQDSSPAQSRRRGARFPEMISLAVTTLLPIFAGCATGRSA